MSEQGGTQASTKRRRQHQTPKQNSIQSPVLQHPTNDDKEAWKGYWEAQGQPWRTEPEIDAEHQKYLAERRSIRPDIEQGIYPFRDIQLSRADIEWLLATHEDGRGPVDWSDEAQRGRRGLDLRGADLCEADLSKLPLANLYGGLIRTKPIEIPKKYHNLAISLMVGATFNGAQLQGASLAGAQLQGADLSGAQLQGADLSGAQLQGADLSGAQLIGVSLFEAQLERANLKGAYLERTNLSMACLKEADFSEVQMKRALLFKANLEEASLFKAHIEAVDLREAQLKNVNLNGAEVQGSNLRGAQLQGASLKGTRVQGAHLSNAIMTAADLRGAQLTGADLVDVQLQGANLEGAELQGADLFGAQLQKANLKNAQLQKADLWDTQLQGADLSEAELEGANLKNAQLEGANLSGSNLKEADLSGTWLVGTDLRRAQLNGALLTNVTLSDKNRIGPRIADVQWSELYLLVTKWSQIEMLGDEFHARRKKQEGKVKNKLTRIEEYEDAVRANRLLAVALQNQGLNEDAVRFAYHAQELQRIALRLQRKFGQYLFSLILSLISGYGYKPIRSFITYAVVISVFAFIYFLLGPHLAWNEAVVISMTAFHGRGFFPDQFHPGDPQALVAAIEAFVGLLIEVTFIATLTQRLFGKR